MLRFTGAVPEMMGRRFEEIREDLQAFLRKISGGVNGLQSQPGTPTTIQAGVASSAGTSQAAAASDITHAIDTAAPSVKVAYSGVSSEGTSPSLVRSDAGFVLADGVSKGDVLVWNGSQWVSTPPNRVVGITVPGRDGEDGYDPWCFARGTPPP